MAAVVNGLLIAALLLGGHAGEQGSGADPQETQTAGVTLTHARREASFPIPAATVERAPAVLALRFTQVTNPAGTAVQISVFLSYRPAEKSAAKPVRILLGNVALYPPDRPGGFVVRASNAFREVKAAKGTGVKLVLEMTRLHPEKPWSHVEVRVARPEWRNDDSP